jgi:hypothetical protein
MAGRALDYRDTIDSFVARNKDLHAFEVSNADWESIKLVTSWLKSFQLATTEMSATKVPMLSTTHAMIVTVPLRTPPKPRDITSLGLPSSLPKHDTGPIT